MNTFELRVARERKGLTRRDVGVALDISPSSYKTKETCEARFTDSQKLKLVDLLDLDFDQFNAIFFEGKLPVEKWGIEYRKYSIA